MAEQSPSSPAGRIGNILQSYGGGFARFAVDVAQVALVSNPAYSFMTPRQESGPIPPVEGAEMVRENQPLILRGGGIYKGGSHGIIHKVRLPDGKRGHTPEWSPPDSVVQEQKRIAWEAKTATLPSLWNTPERYMQQAANLGWEVVESEYGGRPDLYATVNMGEDPTVEDTMAKLRKSIFDTTGRDLRVAGSVKSEDIRRGAVVLNLANLWTPERNVKLGKKALPGMEVLELMTNPELIELMRDRQLPAITAGGAMIDFVGIKTPILEMSERDYLRLSPVDFESTDRDSAALTCLPTYRYGPGQEQKS